MVGKLKIVTLGNLSITCGGEPVTGLASRKAEALLVYLACTGRAQARDLLGDLLWADASITRGRGNLSVVLTSLRQHLGPYLDIGRHTVRFQPEAGAWVDVAELDDQLRGIAIRGSYDPGQPIDVTPLPPDVETRIERVLALYGGDFLAGFTLRDGWRFEEWVRDEQERLRQRVLQVGEALIRGYLAEQRYHAGIEQAAKLLQLDPLHEELHRQVLLLLAYSGQRHAALAHYEACRRLLEDELGVEPAAATTTLFQQIRDDRLPVSRLQIQNRIVVETPRTPVRIHGLPFQPTPFVGRPEEQRIIAERLADPECRLLTLVGPGGIGKTRLAIEATAIHAASFADGAMWVELAALDRPDQIIPAIAHAAGCPLAGQEAPQSQLQRFLAPQQCLLVLDNWEHLVEGAPLLNGLLGAAPRLRILATSRERLQLQAEWLIDIGGMPYPPDNPIEPAASPGDVIAAYPAVELFAQQARRVRPDWRIGTENATAVARICRLVEGTPLAIELAAATIRDQPPDAIAAAIDKSLDGLATTLRDVPARHRSVRAVWEHSWTLLEPDERVLVCQIAIFRGGWNDRAAAEITGATPDLLRRLLDKSLIRRENDGRWSMHRLVQHYAWEHLHRGDDAGAGTVVAGRHSAFYLDWIAQREAALHGPGAPAACAATRTELDNIRQAWQWAVDRVAIDDLDRAVSGLARFYDLAGLFHEACAVFSEAATRTRCVTAPVLRCKLLVEGARFGSRRADYEAAGSLLAEALPLAEVGQALPLQATIHLLVGEILWHQAQYPSAAEHLRAAIALAQTIGHRNVEADALLNLGVVAEMQGDYRSMQQYQAHALAVYQASGDRRGEGLALNNLAIAAHYLGDGQQCRAYFEQALAVAERSNDRYNIARVCNNLGDLAISQGDYSVAHPYLLRALPIQRALGDQRGEAFTLHNLGTIADSLGRYDEACAWYKQALTIREAIGYQAGEAHTRSALGLLAHHIGDDSAARQWSMSGLVLAQKIGAQSLVAAAATNLGHALCALRDYPGAVASYEQALQIGQSLQPPARSFDARAGLAGVMLATGERAAALHNVQAILAELEPGTLIDAGEPFWIYLLCCDVLRSCEDPRALQLAVEARHLLTVQAQRIADPEQRRSFLENVETHRLIMQSGVDSDRSISFAR